MTQICAMITCPHKIQQFKCERFQGGFIMALFEKYHLEAVREKGRYYDISKKVTSPESAVEMIETLEPLFLNAPEEWFVALFLNTKNEYLNHEVISKGSLNASIVHPREVFKRALCYNAASIMVFHNHPSGNTTQSREDENITKRLVEGGNILGIHVLDHIIIAYGDSYLSFKEEGLL